MYDTLLKSCTPKTCLLVIYEDLLTNTAKEVGKVLNFLNCPVNDSTIMECLKENSDGLFRSTKRPKDELQKIYRAIDSGSLGTDITMLYKNYLQRFRNILH